MVICLVVYKRKKNFWDKGLFSKTISDWRNWEILKSIKIAFWEKKHKNENWEKKCLCI
jgi:hypothetical protein